MQRNLTGPRWEWVACERHSLLEWALAKKQKEKEKGEDEKESLLRELGRDTSSAGRCLRAHQPIQCEKVMNSGLQKGGAYFRQ